MSEEQEKAAPTSTENENRKEDSVDTPIGCFRCRKDACRQCWCSINNYWKSLVWLTIIIVYLLLGGVFFNLAEQPAEIERTEEAAAAQLALVMEKNLLIETVVNNSNLTRIEAVAFLQRFMNASQRLNDALAATETGQVWDFASAVFFCVTVITTIGYGNIAPMTGAGQTLFIFYAILGIPLALTFLTVIGTIMTDYLDAALSPLLKVSRGKGNPVLVRGIGLVVFFILALIFIIFIPAGIFYATEDWTYGQSIYYCFVTLTTVGFGDFVPAIAGSSRQTSNSPLTGLYKIIVSVWLWIGLAFVAAIITELTNFIDAITKRMKMSRCCRRGGDLDAEKRDSTETSLPPENLSSQKQRTSESEAQMVTMEIEDRDNN